MRKRVQGDGRVDRKQPGVKCTEYTVKFLTSGCAHPRTYAVYVGAQLSHFTAPALLTDPRRCESGSVIWEWGHHMFDIEGQKEKR